MCGLWRRGINKNLKPKKEFQTHSSQEEYMIRDDELRFDGTAALSNVDFITAGIQSIAERVGYKYSKIEKGHRLRFLFDEKRILKCESAIDRYLSGCDDFPAAVEIDPSNACVHNCRFCIYKTLHSKERSEILPRNILLKVVRELDQLGCRSLLFVGGGEPLVNRYTPEAMELAASHGISVGLVTNGALLSSNISYRIKSFATYVRFSIDAATPETHLRLHRRNDFHRIIENLNALASAPGPCTVGTSFFITRENVDELHAAAALVKTSGANYVQIKTCPGIPIPADLHAKILTQVENTISLSDDRFEVHVLDRVFHNEVFQVRGYQKCHFQAFKMVIGADGSVFPCGQMRNNPDAVLGNIRRATLAEIGKARRGKMY